MIASIRSGAAHCVVAAYATVFAQDGSIADHRFSFSTLDYEIRLQPVCAIAADAMEQCRQCARGGVGRHGLPAAATEAVLFARRTVHDASGSESVVIEVDGGVFRGTIAPDGAFVLGQFDAVERA